MLEIHKNTVQCDISLSLSIYDVSPGISWTVKSDQFFFALAKNKIGFKDNLGYTAICFSKNIKIDGVMGF